MVHDSDQKQGGGGGGGAAPQRQQVVIQFTGGPDVDCVYKGEVKHGKMHGKGILTVPPYDFLKKTVFARHGWRMRIAWFTV